ncbi:hypothetical protein ACWC9T_15035 [Kitasatospora sp. NPDC001159]
MTVFRKPGRSRQPGRSKPAPGTVPAAGPAAPGAGLAEELAELIEQAERPVEDWRVAEYHAERGRGRAVVAKAARRLAEGGLVAARGAALGGKALTEQMVRIAPRIPVRDLAALRAQHPGAADPEQLADLLVAGATRASGALGAGVGAVAMLPVPPALPVEIAAETLAVAAVEVKLIAELHEVYGVPAQGSTAQRAGAYLAAWANRRGIQPLRVRPAGFAALAVGAEVRQRVRRRLTRSSLRRLPSVVPLLFGAGIGATVNRRDTRRLAGKVRADLRTRPPTDRGYWAAAGPAVEGAVIR